MKTPVVIALASFKGGVGKTTAAMHLAGYLSSLLPTMLIDYDHNKSARMWAEQGEANNVKLPFKVVHQRGTSRYAAKYDLHIQDVAAGLTPQDLSELVEVVDLLLVPTMPNILDINALRLTLAKAEEVRQEKYGQSLADFCRVLLSIVPPMPNKDGVEAREMLVANGLPVWETQITRSVALSRTPLQGGMVWDFPQWATGVRQASKEYKDLGEEVARFLHIQTERKMAA